MFSVEHKNEAGQNKEICLIDMTILINEIQFSLFKNGGKILVKKFHRFEFQVGRIEYVASTVSYSKQLGFQSFNT